MYSLLESPKQEMYDDESSRKKIKVNCDMIESGKIMMIFDSKEKIEEKYKIHKLYFVIPHLQSEFEVEEPDMQINYKNMFVRLIHSQFNQKTKFNFPDNVISFIKENNMSDDTLDKIDNVINSATNLLKKQDLQYQIEVKLFTDPEDPVMREIELSFRIKKDLKYIYENVKPSIYAIVDSFIPDVIFDKFFVNFETMK
ncbi:MAG: hypothetical protein ACYDAJ_09055 [Nitrosotalea sp.]